MIRNKKVISELLDRFGVSSNPVQKESPEAFCQVYLTDLNNIVHLQGSELKVLIQCWVYCEYYRDDDYMLPGNMIAYTGYFKNHVRDNTGLTEGTIRNAMSNLVKNGILFKDKYKGVYYLNPKYFFKGKVGDRTRLIRRIAEYRLEA